MIKFLLFFTILFIYSCSNTSPTNVKTSDAQKVTAIEYGIIKSVLPVKIKGESNWIGATAGGMIGGLLGTQVCGEEEIVGTKCQDIAVVFGTIGGVVTSILVIIQKSRCVKIDFCGCHCVRDINELKNILSELSLEKTNLGIEYESYGLTGRNANRLNDSLKNFATLHD